MTKPPIRPIKLVVGGVPALADIVGRDRLAQQICGQLLSSDGVLLTGDRRVGKTTLARLVEDKLRRDGHPVFSVSAERSDFDDFSRAFADEIADESQGRIAGELRRWDVGAKVGPIEATRTRRIPSLDDIVASAVHEAERRPVFIVDEVPVLARAMEQAEPGSGTAMLHTLRRIRQEHSGRASMLLLGSIGFHHVAEDASGSINDIVKEAVGPTSATDAAYLARCLMLGEQVEADDPDEVAAAIAAAAEAVPYYVHHLVASCRRRARPVHSVDIDGLVERALADPDDPWNMRHYRDRLPVYYGPGRAPLVSSVLDVYAGATRPLDIDATLRLVRSQPAGTHATRDELVVLVERLEQDHYLERVGRDSTFRSDLVRRSWLATRR